MKIIATYRVIERVSPQVGQTIYNKFLSKKELVYLSYKNQKTLIVFTDRKIIAVDLENKQGIGPKFMFIPYHNISSFSVETIENMCAESEFSLLISGIGVFEIGFGERINCKEIGQFLNQKILSNKKSTVVNKIA